MSTGECNFAVLHTRRVLQEPLSIIDSSARLGLPRNAFKICFIHFLLCLASIFSQHIHFRCRVRKDGLRAAAPSGFCLPGNCCPGSKYRLPGCLLVAVQDLYLCRLAHTCELKRVRRALSCATTTKERGSQLRKVLALTLRSSQLQRRQATGMHGLPVSFLLQGSCHQLTKTCLAVRAAWVILSTRRRAQAACQRPRYGRPSCWSFNPPYTTVLSCNSG